MLLRKKKKDHTQTSKEKGKGVDPVCWSGRWGNLWIWKNKEKLPYLHFRWVVGAAAAVVVAAARVWVRYPLVPCVFVEKK